MPRVEPDPLEGKVWSTVFFRQCHANGEQHGPRTVLGLEDIAHVVSASVRGQLVPGPWHFCPTLLPFLQPHSADSWFSTQNSEAPMSSFICVVALETKRDPPQKDDSRKYPKI